MKSVLNRWDMNNHDLHVWENIIKHFVTILPLLAVLIFQCRQNKHRKLVTHGWLYQYLSLEDVSSRDSLQDLRLEME